MLGESELTMLVSNIVNESYYSHCRLCLKVIENKYVHLNVFVNSSIENSDYYCLSTLLTKFMGPEICVEIAGIDAICMECVEQVLAFARFFKTCEDANKLLHKVFDNLINKLGDNIDTNKDHSLHIAVSENDMKLAYIKNLKKKTQMHKEHLCTECTVHFDDFDELKEHNADEHGKLTCEKCFESCADENELQIHNESDTLFKCQDCNIHKCSSESLKVHYDKVHEAFVCKHCGKSYRGNDKLLKHEARHATKSACPKCGKTYNTNEFFLRHVKLCLEDRLDPHPIRSKLEKKYSCTECSKGYSTPGGLRVHNRFVHGNAKPHVCDICNKKFTAPSYLKVHMVTHTGAKNFPCDRCTKKFVSKEALLYHTRRHTGEKPYSCIYCRQRFVNASARAEHIKFKHVGPTLICEICSDKFMTKNFLRMHMKKYHDPSNKNHSVRNFATNVTGQVNMQVCLSENEVVS